MAENSERTPQKARSRWERRALQCAISAGCLVPIFAGGLIGAVLAPLFFYPYSKTLWVAIELTLRPIDEAEPSDVRLDRAKHRSVEGTPR